MEIWKTIPGFEGRYEVSNIGNVRALNYNKTGVVKEIKQWHCKGYKHIVIQKEGKRYYYGTHRLVCIAFYGDNPTLDVNHKNGVRDDNRLENLEWCSRSYNIQHKFDVLGYKNNFQTNHPDKGKIYGESRSAKSIVAHTKDGDKIYDSLSRAGAELGIRVGDISACLTGRQKTAKGYSFSYHK